MLLPAVRLAGQLNVLPTGGWSAEVAAHAITGPDAAHHVVDPDDLLGIDPMHAIPLERALPSLADREPVGWVLVLPTPGRLGPLRGPVGLNQAALEAGAAVVGCAGELALVPLGVGQAVQWRLWPGNPPRPDLTPYDAERVLDAAIRHGARTLAGLEVAGGTRPADHALTLAPTTLPAALSRRRRGAADKAVGLLVACEAALGDEGSARSLFEMDARRRTLREIRDAASDALCAALSWSDPEAEADRPR